MISSKKQSLLLDPLVLQKSHRILLTVCRNISGSSLRGFLAPSLGWFWPARDILDLDDGIGTQGLPVRTSQDGKRCTMELN
ncbi:hypothetical protein I3843_15G076200 [Carya illinoinensis]|nr:hypothetical protein I3843_15G076200 [Carya illinoinensis]